MAVNAVRTEVIGAQVESYTVAGKTGTAQIPEGGIYHPFGYNRLLYWLATGRRPADCGSDQAGPAIGFTLGFNNRRTVFAALAEELVVLLGIPPDDVRLADDVVAAEGRQLAWAQPSVRRPRPTQLMAC